MLAVPYVLLVGADAPWRTLDELLRAAKARPGTFTYASGGIGTGGVEFAVNALLVTAYVVPALAAGTPLADIPGITWSRDGETVHNADAPPVREVMKQMQRRIAAGIDVVTEGRDQGSEVFPDAEVMVFLTASPVERALRRHREETARGVPLSLDDVLDAQNRRDEGDRTRPVGAMHPAADAVLVETDGLTPEEVVDRLVRLIEARRRPRHA